MAPVLPGAGGWSRHLKAPASFQKKGLVINESRKLFTKISNKSTTNVKQTKKICDVNNIKILPIIKKIFLLFQLGLHLRDGFFPFLFYLLDPDPKACFR